MHPEKEKKKPKDMVEGKKLVRSLVLMLNLFKKDVSAMLVYAFVKHVMYILCFILKHCSNIALWYMATCSRSINMINVLLMKIKKQNSLMGPLITEGDPVQVFGLH